MPSAKSVVAASDGATVREGRSKVQRVRPDLSPARQAPVTCQLPSSVRWASQVTASMSESMSRSRSFMNCRQRAAGGALAQPDAGLAGLLGDALRAPG